MLILQAAQLQYFEALMLQSEKWGWPQAATSFAQAAMRQTEVVYADSNSPLSDQDKAAWVAERHERRSKLCTNLFVYALEAGRFEVRAVATTYTWSTTRNVTKHMDHCGCKESCVSTT